MNFSIQNKQAYVIGLCVDCPSRTALESCRLTDNRTHSSEARFRLIKQMTESELDAIIQHHRDCFEERTGMAICFR